MPEIATATESRHTASEQAVAKIWAEVLRLPAVARDANFFDLGGDSLKAMDVIARVSEVLHAELPLMEFFEDPTVAHLAGVLDGLKAGETSQETLARIVSEVLRVPGVAPDANFFDLGGDSLKAMDVIARVNEQLQVELPLMAFFEDPTVTHLARVVDELKPAESLAIVRVSGRHEFPLSHPQQAFWLAEQQDPEAGIYSTARVFRIRGKIDSGVLERSLNELHCRHEILRVRFVMGENGPAQVVEEGAPVRLPVSDLSALEPGAREDALGKLLLEAYRKPFDLAGGPLRTCLIRLAADEFVFCVVLNHVAGDGFTGGILMEELGAIYDALAQGEPNPLSPVDLHFTDYAVWERQWMQGSRLEQELEFWRAALQGAPGSLDVPTDFVPPAEADHSGGLRHLIIPDRKLQQLRDLAQANGTTLFTVLSSALRIMLHRWSGQHDFLIGTIAANRSRGGTERMIGCFVNPLPLRNPIVEGQSALELLLREKSAILDAFAHQDCPFAKIVEAVRPERTNSGNPLFNVALLLQNFPAIRLSGPSFEAESIQFDPQMAILDLRFIAMEIAGGLQVSCEYRSSILSEGTADQLLLAYTGVLDAFASDSTTRVADIALSEPLVAQAAAARKRDHQPVVGIAASFTAEPLEGPLALLFGELGMTHRVAFAPYQQVFQQLLDPASLLRTCDGFGIVLVRFEDWLNGDNTASGQREKAEAVASELIAALRAARDSAAPMLVCFCPASQAVAANSEMRECLDHQEARVADAFAGSVSVHVIRSGEILDLYPVEQYEDAYAQRLGNLPYTADFFSALGTFLVRRMWNAAQNHYKVIAMECDDVVWTGVCGEGREVIVDEPRLALQNALKEQLDGGMLLCLCSSGREEDIWTAFESNASMPLQRDDMIAAAAGGRSSADKLVELAGEIGFGLESFIFLHSDPDECAAIEAACPEVLTLQVPTAADEIAGWLRHVWALDRCARTHRHGQEFKN